jgi:hypothetical protein
MYEPIFVLTIKMNLLEEILKGQSKERVVLVATWIGSDKRRFAELMDLVLNGDLVVVQRASWIMNLVFEKHPQLVTPYLDQLLPKMHEKGQHVALKRHIIRILQDMDIPEKHHGAVMNACFDFLADPAETVAVRCFSMSVLDNLSRVYPEIRQELVAILEDQLEQEATAGFRSRAKKILKRR